MRHLLIGLLLPFLPLSSFAAVYKCVQENGKVVYQAEPCAAGNDATSTALKDKTSGSFAPADKLFVGSYESETRENFGTDTYGEYKIEISAIGPGKYMATMSQGLRSLGRAEIFPCAAVNEPYLAGRPGGLGEVLCSRPGTAFISYAENGIIVPAFDMTPIAKGEANPSKPPTMKNVHRKAKYYARAGWGIYGFRKIGG